MYKKFLFSLAIALAAVCAMSVGTSYAVSAHAPGGIGDALLGTLYDVRSYPGNLDLPERAGVGTWENFIEIQNTTNKWVAAHLRFRTFRKSIEVWDHIILLSPYDVFWLYLTEKADGTGVKVASSDWHTLGNSGLISQADAAAGKYNGDPATPGHYEWYQNFSQQLLEANGFPTDITELEYGEIELIGLWSINSTAHTLTFATNSYVDPDPYWAASVNVYDILFTAWGGIGDNFPLYALVGGYSLDDCPNVLKASAELGDTITGQYYSYAFEALADFRTDNNCHRDFYPGGAILYPVKVLLVGSERCYAGFPYAAYLNPDWATTAGPTLRDGDNLDCVNGDDGGFNGPWSLDEVELALARTELWGFYLTGDTFGNGMPLTTEVNLTFPTKYLHYFVIGSTFPEWQNGYAFCANYTSAVIGKRATKFVEWEFYGNGPILTEGKIFNVDQDTFGFSPGPSPFEYFGPYVPHEVNLMHFGDDTDLSGQPMTNIFHIPDQYKATFKMGQFSLTNWYFLFPWTGGAGDANVPRSLPVIGMTTRIHNVGGTAVYRSTSLPLMYKNEIINEIITK